jgi:hypothetical protein
MLPIAGLAKAGMRSRVRPGGRIAFPESVILARSNRLAIGGHIPMANAIVLHLDYSAGCVCAGR